MIAANNKDGKRVTIDYAIKGEPYFCPICNQPLIQKHGVKRQPHFAHVGIRKGYAPCRDIWTYDKTDWHIEWQKRFPESCYEKVVTHGDKKHIADVLINKLVIEFQHSPISLKDFLERNTFYTSCGYKVVWVFDLSEEWSSEAIVKKNKEGGYSWSYPKKLFREMEFKTIQATIYFQLEDCGNADTAILERVKGGYNRFTEFYTDSKHRLSISEFVKFASECEQKITPQKFQKPEVPDAVEGGKTICDLWKHNFSGMVVQNLVTGNEMLINGENGAMYRQYRGLHKIIGKYSNQGPDHKYQYSDYYPVWDDDKAVWILKKAFFSKDYLENEKIDKEISKRHIHGERLDQLLLKTSDNVFHCLFNNKYYYLQLSDNTRMRYYAYEFDPTSGEVNDTIVNELVNKLQEKSVWKVYHPKDI